MTYSIVVAIYNIEKYLRQCLDSILAQTKTEYEVVLVDDGSGDASAAICDEYAAKDLRVKVIHKENGGLMTARKAGLRAATGEYICFVDGDDFVAPDFLEVYDWALQRKKVDIVCTGYTSYVAGEETPVIPKPNEGYYDKEALIRDIYPNMLSEKPFFAFGIAPSVWSKCFRRSLMLPIYEIVPDGISLGEDTAVTYPALLAAESVYFLHTTAYRYRENPASITHSYDAKLYNKISPLVHHIKKYENNEFCDMKGQIKEYIAFLAYLAGTNEFFYNKKDSFFEKKRKMNRVLKDAEFREALQYTSLRQSRYRAMPYCLKYGALLPLHILSKLKK